MSKVDQKNSTRRSLAHLGPWDVVQGRTTGDKGHVGLMANLGGGIYEQTRPRLQPQKTSPIPSQKHPQKHIQTLTHKSPHRPTLVCPQKQTLLHRQTFVLPLLYPHRPPVPAQEIISRLGYFISGAGLQWALRKESAGTGPFDAIPAPLSDASSPVLAVTDRAGRVLRPTGDRA